MTHQQQELLRALNGETIPMPASEVKHHAPGLIERGYVYQSGHVLRLTGSGKLKADQLKKSAIAR